MTLKKVRTITFFKALYRNLPFLLVILHTLFLLPACFSFAEDLALTHARCYDSWLLSQSLYMTSHAFHSGEWLNFFKGLVDLSYGPLFWCTSWLTAYPFFIADNQAAFIIAPRLLSLIAGTVAWISIVSIIKRYLTTNPLLITLALLPGLLSLETLHLQTLIHPDTLSILCSLGMLYYLVKDHENKQKFSPAFSKALVFLIVGVSLKFNASITGSAIFFHILFFRKNYSWKLFRKHTLLTIALLGTFHFPLLHPAVLKQYAGRLLFLSKQAKNFGDWPTYISMVKDKLTTFNEWIFSPVMFCIVILISVYLFFRALKGKNFTLDSKHYLVFLALFLFALHGMWVITGNYVIWIHYAFICCFLLPILMSYIGSFYLAAKFSRYPLLLFFSLGAVSAFLGNELKALTTKAITFLSLKNQNDKILFEKELRDIKNILLSAHLPSWKCIAATPPINIAPVSLKDKLEFINIRVSSHFKNLGYQNPEIIIVENAFYLHDMPQVQALSFLQKQSYMKRFMLFHQDKKFSIFVRRDYLEQ